jgi:hypothetical protein
MPLRDSFDSSDELILDCRSSPLSDSMETSRRLMLFTSRSSHAKIHETSTDSQQGR